MNKTSNTNKANESEPKDKADTLFENGLYWLYSSENFLLVKLTKIVELKEICFKEQEIIISENQMKISENPFVPEKKIAYKDRHLFKSFSRNQLDFSSDNLLDTADISYPSLLYNLKLKLQEGRNNIIKAGKIFLGINLVASNKTCYESFIAKFFNLKFDSEKKFSFLVNGLPNTGKSEMVREFIRKVINQNFFNFQCINNINNNNFSDHNYNNVSNSNSDINGICKNEDHLQESSKRRFTEKIFMLIALIDLFGNTVEKEFRMNCSRYMRIIKFYYKGKANKNSNYTYESSQNSFNTDSNNQFAEEEKQKKVKLNHFLFEKNRILNSGRNKFYFHIVHAVFHGLESLLSNDDQNPFCKQITALFPDYVKCLIESFSSHADFINDITANEFKQIYRSLNFFASNDHKNEDLVIIKFFREKFALLLNIFSDLSLHKKIVVKICNLILLIFYFKELAFSLDIEEKVCLAIEANKNLQRIFTLMSLDSEEEKGLLIKKLTAREIISPSGSLYLIKYSLEEATREKDNLVKFLYENLFKFIEKFANLIINAEYEKKLLESLNKTKINADDKEKSSNDFGFFNFNKTSKQEKKDFNYLQIIECFGFENSADPFENNLENLIINYSNDKMNNIFFDSLIKNELETYEKEGISAIPHSSSDSLQGNSSSGSSSGNEVLFNQLAQKFLKKENKTNTSSVGGALNNQASNNSNKEAISKRNSVIGRPNFSRNSGLLEQDIDKTITICEEASKGIFSTINSQSVLIKNNKGLISSLINNVKTNWPEITVTQNSFFLQHIGGLLVEYGGEDFILRNTDFVKEDLKILFKDLFKNLVSLSLKNFNFDKEGGSNSFWKIKNFSPLEINSNNTNSSNISGNNESNSSSKINERKPRSSAYGKPGGSTRKKFHCEVFMGKFKKIISSIANSDLGIIKLLKTGTEKQIKDSMFDLKHNGSESENQLAYLDSLKFDFADHNKLQNLNNVYKNKFCFEFDNKFFLKQIYSAGILESVLLTKSGFFFRSDFEQLKSKLKPFRGYFDFLDLSEDKQNKEVSLNSTSDSNQLGLNWTPNKQFIKTVSGIISVNESDIVIGKSCVFLRNQAIITQNNNHYFKLKDLPSLVIFGIFKIAIRKVYNTNKVLKYIKQLLNAKKAEKFFIKLIWFFKKNRFEFFCKQLRIKSCFYLGKVKTIQRNLKQFVKLINKARVIQRNLRVFSIKQKVQKKKAAGKSIILFAMKYYERNFIYLANEFFKSLRDLINKRINSANTIKNNFKSFIYKKKTAQFSLIMLRVFKIKMTRKFLSNLVLKGSLLVDLIKIQSKFRSVQAKRKHIELTILRDKREESLKKFIETNLNGIYCKKLFGDFIHKYRKCVEIKNSKAILLQQNLKKYVLKRKIIKENNAKKALRSLENLFNASQLNAKKKAVQVIKEEINKVIQEKKDYSAIKLSSFLRRNKAMKKVEQLKIEKKEKEIQLLTALTTFEKKVLAFKNQLVKQSFLSKLSDFTDYLVKKESNALKIQTLFRKNKAKKEYESRNLNNKNLNSLISKITKVDFILKAKFFFDKLIKNDAFIVQKHQQAVKIQALIRKKNSVAKYKEYKQAETSKKLLAKDLNLLFEKIERLKQQKDKLNSLKKLDDFCIQHKIKEQSVTKLQTILRSKLSKNKLNELKLIKEEEIRIFNNKLDCFEGCLQKFIKVSNKKICRGFIEKLKILVETKENSAALVQRSYKKMLSLRKAKALTLQKLIGKVIEKQAKFNLLASIKAKHKQYLDTLNKSVTTIQSLFRVKSANRKLQEIKEELVNKRIVASSGKITEIIFNHSLGNIEYRNKLKKEFLNKLKLLNLKVNSTIKIQTFHRKRKLNKAKAERLKSSLKALTKLDNLLDLKSISNKMFFLNQINEVIRKQKIFNFEKKNKTIFIQKTFKKFLKTKQQKELQKKLALRNQKLISLINKTESKNSFNFLRKNFMKFKHSLKIRNIVETFCFKLQRRVTTAKYFKKLVFLTWKKAYLSNKHNIFLKKLFLKYANPYFKKQKSDFISAFRVASKYFFNKIKDKKTANSQSTPVKEQNTNGFPVSKTLSAKNILRENENSLKKPTDSNASLANLNPRLSAKSKPANALINGLSAKKPELNQKVKIAKVQKIESQNSSKDLSLRNNDNDNKQSKFNTIEAKKSEKSLNLMNSTVSDFDFFGPEIKRFKFDRNLLNGIVDDEDEERVFKYNAANNLISKYSRASHKISAEPTNERKSAIGALKNFNKNSIEVNSNASNKNLIGSHNNNNNNNFVVNSKESGRLSTFNINTSSRTSLNGKVSLTARKSVNTKPIISAGENKPNPAAQAANYLRKSTISGVNLVNENNVNCNTNTSRKSAIISDKIRAAGKIISSDNACKDNQDVGLLLNREVPSYQDLVDLSSSDLAHFDREKTSSRKTVACKPKINFLDNLPKENNRKISTTSINNNNNNDKKVKFEQGAEKQNGALGSEKSKLKSNTANSNKNEELFDFNVNKRNSAIKKDSSKSLMGIKNLKNFNKKEESVNDITGRIEAVFKNLDMLTMLKDENISDLNVLNRDKVDCENHGLNSDGSQHSHNFQRVCMGDYLRNKK